MTQQDTNKRFLYYGTYSITLTHNWYVDIIIDLQTELYEIFLLHPDCANKKLVLSVPMSSVNSTEDLFLYLNTFVEQEICSFVADQYATKDFSTLATMNMIDPYSSQQNQPMCKKHLTKEMESIIDRMNNEPDFTKNCLSFYERSFAKLPICQPAEVSYPDSKVQTNHYEEQKLNPEYEKMTKLFREQKLFVPRHYPNNTYKGV